MVNYSLASFRYRISFAFGYVAQYSETPFVQLRQTCFGLSFDIAHLVRAEFVSRELFSRSKATCVRLSLSLLVFYFDVMAKVSVNSQARECGYQLN